MSAFDFELLWQEGAGPDGVLFCALASDGETVDVHQLAAARADPVRWAEICGRLQRAATVVHPNVLPVRALALDGDAPYVALPAFDARLADETDAFPLPAARAAQLAGALSSALCEAHRMGVVVGDLGPTRVRLDESGAPRLDVTGLSTSGLDTGADLVCAAPDADQLTPAADVYALAVLLAWVMDGQPPAADPSRRAPIGGAGSALGGLLARMLGPDPDARPTAAEAALQLSAEELDATVESAAAAGPRLVGRFELGALLGEGGAGQVFRATDRANGDEVALKLIRPGVAAGDGARRFLKEARVLGRLRTPYITNLVEANTDGDQLYLAMEFVRGTTVRDLLSAEPHLEERRAIAIAADVARALADVHALGFVHRDVKPDNVMVLDAGGPTHAKLCDFGIARSLDQTADESVTRTGMVVGTPHFMSPEQCRAQVLTAAADVYSLGATVYRMLTGRNPFSGTTAGELFEAHILVTPKPVKVVRPELSDGVSDLVARMLAKEPAARPPDGAAALDELERLLRGEASGIHLHPRLPDIDESKLLTYTFEWDLEASPDALWPLVADTDRLNRAIGLAPFHFEVEPGPHGPIRRASARISGIEMAWVEHPYEWIEGRRMGVLRAFTRGPFRVFRSVWTLDARPGGGTHLVHCIQVEPNGMVGRAAAALEIGMKARRNLDRVYRRIDETLALERSTPSAIRDPFEARVADPDVLEAFGVRLATAPVDEQAVARLGAYVASAAPQSVARIRPLALARRLDVDAEALVCACLYAVEAGLLSVVWDLLCPKCRISADIRETLREVEQHGRCEVCDLDFDLDFAESVELVFRAHPDIRDVELATYCVGGPARSAHIVAQIRMAPDERFVADLQLADGGYRIAGPQLPYTLTFRVLDAAPMARWDLPLRAGFDVDVPRSLSSGHQRITLVNDYDREVLVRVERTADRGDALTAARALAMRTFRELFPGERLAAGRLVSVRRVALLLTDAADADALYADDEARAFARLHDHMERMARHVEIHGGALVKVHGDGVLAAFDDLASAARAALSLSEVAELSIRAVVHAGPAYVATVNDLLDYFGTTVRATLRLLRCAEPGEVVLSDVLLAEPEVAMRVRERGPAVRAGDVVGRRITL